MGFDGIELIVSEPPDLTSLWTERFIDDVRRQLDKYKMTVSQMAMFQPVVEDLSSLDYDKRMRALDNFEAGTVIGKKLGSGIVNIVAPWPREIREPKNGYLPRYYEIMRPKENEVYAPVMDRIQGFYLTRTGWTSRRYESDLPKIPQSDAKINRRNIADYQRIALDSMFINDC